MTSPRSVLIVRLSAIGDVIHALPVLDALRRALPDARLGWVVEELSAPLLEHHPDLDKLYVIPKKRWKRDLRGHWRTEIRPYFRAMAADGWDAAVDLQGLTKSGLVAWAGGARLRVGYGDRDGREINKLFTNRRIKPPEALRHVVERNLSLLRGLGIEPDMTSRGRLGLLDGEIEAMRATLAEAGLARDQRFALVNPGAGWPSKRWDPARLGRAAAMISSATGLRPLVLWGPGEEPMRDAVIDACREAGGDALAAPPTRIRPMAVIISLASLFIGGDTGPTHLAGLLGIPTVSIFGASDGARNRPWPRESGPVVQRIELACVPCWKTACPLSGAAHMACLEGLEPRAVVDAAVSLLGARA